MEDLNIKIKEAHETSQKYKDVASILIAVNEGDSNKVTSAIKGNRRAVEALVCLLIEIIAEQTKVPVMEILMDVVGALSEES